MITAPGRDLARSFYGPLAQLYTGATTGPLGPADTGQAWTLVESDAPARLAIVNGALTNETTAAGVRAGYVTAQLGAAVTTIGARFTFGPGDDDGAVALVIWRTPLRDVVFIPDSGLHLVVTPAGWSLNAWEAAVPSAPFGGTSFAAPLATDGATVHTVDVTIAGSTAHVTPPAGAAVDVTDSRIASLAGPFACFEVYQADASTDTKAAFVEVWAS